MNTRTGFGTMKLLRDPVWQFIFGFLGFLGLIFTIWLGFYINRRELSYQVASQTPLVSISPDAGDDIVVFFQGKPVTNVFVSTIVLLNTGGSIITSEDFDRNTPIEFVVGSNADILSASVFSTIPNGLVVSLRQEGKSIFIDPVLLNPGGEIRFKVITIGDSDAIAVKSSISGINAIRQITGYSNDIPSVLILGLAIALGALTNLIIEGLKFTDESLIAKRRIFELIRLKDFLNSKRTIFRENFDGTQIDSKIWMVDENSGSVEVKGGALHLFANETAIAFPYIRTREQITPKSGNFAIKVGIQYVSVGAFGAGVVFFSKIPDNLGSMNPGDKGIWQDVDHREPGKNKGKPLDNKYHDIEFHWMGTYYEFIVDGFQVEREEITADMIRPVGVLIGNNAKTAGGFSWSSFRIDYIEVIRL